MTKVSVIVPLYNGRDWIGQALESLRRQTFQDFEAIILDDGSMDNGPEAVKPFLGDGRFRYVSKTHGGIPHTRNRGLAEAQGEFLAFLDQDDLYEPGKLKAQAEWLGSHPDAGLVYTGVLRIAGDGRALGPRELPGARDGRLFDVFLGAGVAVPLLSVMARRSVFKDVGPFDETLFGTDDFDWLLRAADRHSFGFIPEPLVRQRYRPGTTGQTERMHLDRFRLAEKMRGLWPEQSARINDFERRARYLYGSELLAGRRKTDARAQFSRALALRPADGRAAAKWILSWL